MPARSARHARAAPPCGRASSRTTGGSRSPRAAGRPSRRTSRRAAPARAHRRASRRRAASRRSELARLLRALALELGHRGVRRLGIAGLPARLAEPPGGQRAVARAPPRGPAARGRATTPRRSRRRTCRSAPRPCPSRGRPARGRRSGTGTRNTGVSAVVPTSGRTARRRGSRPAPRRRGSARAARSRSRDGRRRPRGRTRCGGRCPRPRGPRSRPGRPRVRKSTSHIVGASAVYAVPAAREPQEPPLRSPARRLADRRVGLRASRPTARAGGRAPRTPSRPRP